MFTSPALAPSAAAAAAQRKPRRRNVRVAVGVVIAAYVSGPLSNDFILPALPALMADYAVDEAAAQTALSLVLLGTGLGCLILGPLSDALGRVPVLAYSFLCYAIASLACAYAPDIETLGILRFVQGFAGACAPVVGLAVINDMLGRTQASTANSRAISVMAFIAALIPLAGTLLIEYFGWRSLWFATAAYGLVLAVATARILPETHPKRARRPLRPVLVLTYLRMLRSPIFLCYSAAAAFAFSSGLSYIGPHSFIVLTTLEMPTHLFVLLFMPLPLGVFFGARFAVATLHRIGVDRTMLRGCLLQLAAGLGFVLLGHFSEPVLAPLLVMLSVLAFSMGMVMPCSQVACVKAFPNQSGAASALSRMLTMVAAAAAMQIAMQGFDGWVKHPSHVIAGCAALAAASAAIGGRLWERRERALAAQSRPEPCAIIAPRESNHLPGNKEHEPQVAAG